MSRAARFKQADLTRAIVGAKKAGMRVGSVEIDATGAWLIQRQAAYTPQGWERARD